MSGAMKCKINVTKSHLRVLLFKKLKQKGLGTNGIEGYLKREVREPSQRAGIRSKLLSFKIVNAIKEEDYVRKAFEKKYSYIKKRWGHHGFIFQQFNISMQELVSEVWYEGREKMKNKLAFWTTKARRKPPPEVPEELEGVLISEDLLRAKFEDPVIKPLIYGGVELSEPEKVAIMLGPKFTLYDDISLDKMAVASEATCDKLRWEVRSRQERDGEAWSEDHELEKVKEHTVFDETNNTMDFAKQRVTNMKFCRRVTIPNPGKDSEEVTYASMKAEIEAATKKYIAEKCDSKGKLLSQNVDKETRDGIKLLRDRVKYG